MSRAAESDQERSDELRAILEQAGARGARVESPERRSGQIVIRVEVALSDGSGDLVLFGMSERTEAGALWNAIQILRAGPRTAFAEYAEDFWSKLGKSAESPV